MRIDGALCYLARLDYPLELFYYQRTDPHFNDRCLARVFRKNAGTYFLSG